MSYILDALKKSQAENDPAARHSLANERQDQRRYRNLLILIVLALLGNVLILVYIFAPGPWQQTASDSTAPSGTAPAATTSTPAQAAAEQRTVAGSPEQQPAAASRPVVRAASEAAAGTAVNADPGREATPAARPVTPVSAPQPPAPVHATPGTLPASVRARFPNLEFSTHLYANDPDLRAVVVNGQRLQEGDRLGNLSVEEITESGVVFAFENYLVTVNVLDEWQ